MYAGISVHVDVCLHVWHCVHTCINLKNVQIVGPAVAVDNYIYSIEMYMMGSLYRKSVCT